MDGLVEYLNEDGTYVSRDTFDNLKAINEDVKIYEKDLDGLAKVSEENIESLEDTQDNCYYYNQLSTEERKVYLEILDIVSNMQSDVCLSTTDEDLICSTFRYVQNDHPEIFYVDGFSYTRYLIGDELKKITLSGNYNIDIEDRAVYQEHIDEYTNQFIKKINSELTESADDYERIKYTYDYIINNTEYNVDAPFNQSIVSVMCFNESVCQGYAKTMQYLLNMQGIEATLVTGNIIDGEGHAFNLVKSDGYYYYLDVTWGDASYNINAENEELLESIPPVNYDYLLITYDNITKTHEFDELSMMPQCSCRTDNYYVRENLYFTEVDESQLREVFAKAYDNNQSYIILKMADSTIYDNMWKYLLEEQHVFEYLNGLKSVSYVENIDSCYMVFWI